MHIDEKAKLTISEHFQVVHKTARYYTVGQLNEETSEVWVVLHGYGQLARYFIKNFEPIFANHRFIIAPEALSRFYLDAQYDRVGASWMTKENRLTEISDYNSYLENLISGLLVAAPSVTINVLGFSQGAATMWRWLNHTHLKIDNAIIWAGMIPAEYQKLDNRHPFRLIAVVGKNDPYITPERKNTFQQLITDSGKEWSLIEFEGGHNIQEDALLRVSDLLRNKTSIKSINNN